MKAAVVFLLALFSLAGPSARLFAASSGIVTPEPGYTLAGETDWTAGVLNVEITRTLDASVPSLLRAKGDAETEIDERLPEFLLQAAGSVPVDSSHTLDELLGADANLHARVSALILKATRTAAYLSPDFSTLVERFAVPFYGPQGIAQPFFPSQATLIRILPGDVTTRRYTGLLIDARGYLPEVGTDRTARLQPALFPRIWNEQMDLVMDLNACDPESLVRWGMVGYVRTPDDDEAIVRAGTLPLRLVARAVFGDKGTDVVIPTDGARQILALPENITLLREGRVVIVYGDVAP
jgi:hypothetical protein